MTTTVLISDPAGFTTQRIACTGTGRSWALRGAGNLSTEILNRDLIAYGLNDELRGHQIICQDDDAGTWGGIITDTQSAADGTTEIAAEDFGALLAMRRLPGESAPLYGPAGTLALIAITEAVRQHGTQIVNRTADDLGAPVSLDLSGDLREALDSMADETGQEWWIDPATLAFYWGVKGSDKTGTVQLIDARHIIDWRLPSSIEPVVNDIHAFPADDTDGSLQSIIVENATSIGAVGRRQSSASIAGGSQADHIRSRALGLVDELAAMGQAIEMDVINTDRCFADFREGDTICVLLTAISVRLTVRVLARSLDDAGVMSVAGDVLTRTALA